MKNSAVARSDVPYRYLEDIATADVAFEAWGENVEETFVAAADATMNVMVGDLTSISNLQRRTIEVSADEVDMLLFEMLQELIFYKDAERLLLRLTQVIIREDEGYFTLKGEAYGEELDLNLHELIVDVKAVTLHRFEVKRTDKGWVATVVLDI